MSVLVRAKTLSLRTYKEFRPVEPDVLMCWLQLIIVVASIVVLNGNVHSLCFCRLTD